ncbi:MAG: outer membrane lipoprotein carrier protein LolA [Acetobacteraceae bacterium]
MVRMLNRRTVLLCSFLSLAAGSAALGQPQTSQRLTPQDKADLARIEAYLNGLHNLKAQFLQVAPDGGVSRGTVWLERPGHMRFQYDPPAPFLLVANHGILVFHDSSLRQTSNIPLGRTPLGILLADRVSLSGDVTVTGIRRLPGQIQVSLVRTDQPGEGTLTLIFADAPLALRQWMVLDAQRQETRVTLHNIETGGRFDPKLFEFNPQSRVPNLDLGG